MPSPDGVPHSDHVLVCVTWPPAHTCTNIAQIAGSVLPGDIFARYHRLAGHAVLMVSGSDEYAAPVSMAADRAGTPPAALAAHYHIQLADLWTRLGIDWDTYSRSTTKQHTHTVQQFFQRLLERGYLYRGAVETLYCTVDHCFLLDRSVQGICPHCGFQQARGDQCDGCARMLDPLQLLDPCCRLCGAQASALEVRQTERFFFDLPRLRPELLAWVRTGKEHWRPMVANRALAWLADGSRALPFTAELDWGVPVPLEGYPGQRIVAGFAALAGAFSASVEWAQAQGTPHAWQQWWVPRASATGQPATTRAYYFTQREGIPACSVVLPALLMGMGDLPLPYAVVAGEDLRMAPHTRAAVSTREPLERCGADALRYYLAATLPESRPSTFSYDALIARNNRELVAIYGNAVHRVLCMVQRGWGGRVPQPGPQTPADMGMLELTRHGIHASGAAIEAVRLRDGLAEALRVARALNGYLESQAPWRALHGEMPRAATILYTAVAVLNGLKVLFAPYVPFSSQRLHVLLGFAGEVMCDRWQLEPVPVGQLMPAPVPLFPKLAIPIHAGVR